MHAPPNGSWSHMYMHDWYKPRPIHVTHPLTITALATLDLEIMFKTQLLLKMNVSLLLVSCALALCFVSCSARWEDGNDGVERIGANLPGTPIKLKIGAAPSDCAQLCYADPRCEAWSFRKASCEPSNTSLCFMKVEVVGQSPNKCTVSW